MNLWRGFFRLSIVAAICAALYAVYCHQVDTDHRYSADLELWRPLNCAKAFLKADTLARYENASGIIDLQRVTCATRTFWARRAEIEATSETPPMPQDYWSLDQLLWNWLIPFTLLAFLAVNLLGATLIGGRALARWIARGFASSS